MTATVAAPEEGRAPGVARVLDLETPFGRPVRWARAAMVSDIGDSHELNDDRCLVLTHQDLGQQTAAPLGEFMLCVLADGATGSTFTAGAASRYPGDSPKQAGWRASQIAQAAFVERFLSSLELDVLERLKEGLRAADHALLVCDEGVLSTTLVALFLSADGTACAASIGDSVLLVLPPKRKKPGDRRLKKLGYEDSTSVGSGDTTLASVDESQLIEQWWPHKEFGGSSARVERGTFMVLMSDGISDTLPAETVDELLRRYPLERATVALPRYTRERRMQTQKQGGGSTQQLGLDNMSAIVVRFDGVPRLSRGAAGSRVENASLVCALGTCGGPTADAGGQFGVICLAGQEAGASVAPRFLRHLLESEHTASMHDRLSDAFVRSRPWRSQARFAVTAVDTDGSSHAFAAGGARVAPAD